MQKNSGLFVKTIGKKVLKLAKYYYLLIFWVRRRSIDRFDELVKQKNICFTIELHKSGFTDQLIQFVVIHNIGVAMNLQFTHTKLHSERSFFKNQSEKHDGDTNNRFEDVYDFLGINKFFGSISYKKPEEETTRVVNYDLKDDSFFRKRGIAEKKNLASYLKLKLSEEIEVPDKNILIKFRLKGHSSFFNLFNFSDEYHKFRYDFREIYKKERVRKPMPDIFEKNAHPLFVHIRQGDTAVLKTPWNTFVLVWGRMKNAYKEFLTFAEINNAQNLSVDVYYRFLNDLLSCTDPGFFSAKIYSDGFQRTFQKMYMNVEKMNWTDDQFEQLRISEQTYNEGAFKKFYELEDVKISVGEENEKLYELIHAALNARVVIIGTQQKMIPKLLSVYCDPSNMPLVIVLTDKSLASLKYFSREELLPFFIRVDVSDYNPEIIANRVRDFLRVQSKHKS